MTEEQIKQTQRYHDYLSALNDKKLKILYNQVKSRYFISMIAAIIEYRLMILDKELMRQRMK